MSTIAPPAHAHVPTGGDAAFPQRADVQVEHRRPFVVGHIPGPLVDACARVVHEYAQAGQRSGRLVDAAFDVRVAGQVGGDRPARQALLCEPRRGLGIARGVPADERHLRPAGRERLDERQAEAAVASGHQRAAPGEGEHVEPGPGHLAPDRVWLPAESYSPAARQRPVDPARRHRGQRRPFRQVIDPRSAMAGGGTTLGAEEEFFVVDESGRLSYRGPDLADAEDGPRELQHELARGRRRPPRRGAHSGPGVNDATLRDTAGSSATLSGAG